MKTSRSIFILIASIISLFVISISIAEARDSRHGYRTPHYKPYQPRYSNYGNYGRHRYGHRHRHHDYRPYVYGALIGSVLGGAYIYDRYTSPPVVIERVYENPVYIEREASPAPSTTSNTDRCIADVEQMNARGHFRADEYQTFKQRCYNIVNPK